MPLAACPDCGDRVSTSARTCPHCGRPGPFGAEPAPQPVSYAVSAAPGLAPRSAMDAFAAPPELECPVCRDRVRRSFCSRCDQRALPPQQLPPHHFPRVPVEYAGFGARLGAALIDGLVLLPFTALCMWIETRSPGGAVLGAILSVLLTCGYEVGMHAANGQTVGKRVLDIQVRRADGRAMTLDAAFMRYLPFIVSGALGAIATIVAAGSLHAFEFPYAGGIFARARMLSDAEPGWAQVVSTLSSLYALADAIVFFCNPRRRALHDYIAGTAVVHV